MILSNYRFSAGQRRILSQLVPIACPAEVERLGVVEQVVDGAELFIRSLSPELRAGFTVVLRSFDLSAAVRPSSRGRTFAQLDRARAAEHFARWWHNRLPPVHAVAKGLKALVAMAYYDLPAVRRALDYQPNQWISKVRERRRERHREAIEAHERELLAPDPLLAARDRAVARAAAGEESR